MKSMTLSLFIIGLISSTTVFAAPAKKTRAAVKPARVAQTAPAQTAAAPKHIDMSKDLDTLGGNEALVEMAGSIDPDNRSRIVQQRLVDRYNRLEVGLNYGAAMGGDSYLRSQAVGAAADFHLTPRWSVGVRYYDYGNTLTPEGERAFNDARNAYEQGGRTWAIPDLDLPMRSVMGVVNWYPVYGKTNLMDIGIAQFDMYLLAGGGQIELSSGWTSTYTAGGGIGFWLTKHLSARAEVRYQNYQDKIITGSRNIHATNASLGMGFLL